MRDALPAALLLVASAVFVAGLTFAAPLPAEGPVAAVFPPWTSREAVLRSVSESGASLLRHGALDTIAIVRGERADLADSLRSNGAWLVVDPAGAAGCFAPGAKTRYAFLKEKQA